MNIDAVKEEILSRTNIVDIISYYTKLKSDGNKYKGLSPFSSEKTPSFYASPDKGVYYCFSTHQGGDMFTFVQKMEGVDFIKSLEIISQKVGIDITKFENKNTDYNKNKKHLSDILESALILYKKQLNEKVNTYLENRGINTSIVEKWEIGFAPNLFNYCTDNLNYTKESIAMSGLICLKDTGTYDRFKNRIVFPLRDSNNVLVGFAGRIYEENKKQSKYINSPETDLYHKSRFLYGLCKAKTHIKKHDFSILTEGYLDVVMAHETKFQNTVACSGTGVTKDHLKILKNISNKIIIAFDGDASGTFATIKAAKMSLEMSMDVKVLDLENGKDPADIILKDKKIWYEKIKKAKTIVEFLLQKIQAKSKNETDMIAQVQEHIIPLISITENDMLKEKYIQSVSLCCNVSCDSVKKRISLYSNGDEYERKFSRNNLKKDSNDDKLYEQINQFVDYAKEKQISLSKNTNKLLEELEECKPVVYNKSKISEFIFEISNSTNNFNIDLEIFKNSKRFLFNYYKKILLHISGEKDWADLRKLDNLNKEWENMQKKLQKLNKLSYND